ncbi:SMP-30/gluconolactonase/LRE family protein [Sphingomonas sp. RP10(2022)]|uniref:SMP-30/gluconolactonase/LRE family protein n=1 Tax=Sphingomonas liriopis TaxID=2949094 RepID=A0A9X2HMS1_9SPHN|nr:SMP-30/gluconolactonase/LRE family protein [Sphingomonas liriopis]MCP3734011.1 SMP-30/gluconolactonase/LRE family protein [Sphingomonas liriopis]
MSTLKRFRTLVDRPLGVGESPVWDHRSGVLWFIDIARPAIYRCGPNGEGLTEFATPSTVGSIGLAGSAGLVAGLRDGVHLFDPDNGTWDRLCAIEEDRPENRLNDGRVGPDGAFWIGTMFEHMPYQPTAALYRVAPDGAVKTIRTDLHVSNGLGWSPDGRLMYHVDSVVPEIDVYDFDPATGDFSATRVLTAFNAAIGHPDGAAVDAQGHYWSAGVSAGRLNRFAPDGTLVESIELPVPWPTMPCFGGENLRTLYLTSMSHDGAEGSLIAIDVEVPGIRADIFGQSARQG